MSLFDDDRPKKPQAHEIGSDLSLLSADELRQRIALLSQEIARLEAECAAKTSGRKQGCSVLRT
jgi:uncharacterized small protein (DUF1192 family)